MESTQVKNNVSFLVFCSRVSSIFTRSRNNKPKRVLEISAPFDLKLGPVSLPGVSQDELAILRDRAAASRVGTIETIPRSSSSMSSWDCRTPVTSNPAHVGATSRAVW